MADIGNFILLTADDEIPETIQLQTSRKTSILNRQYKRISFQERNITDSLEQMFESKFQGGYNPNYNCHGLTFASKRTGVYEDGEIKKIITDEYEEIKVDREVVIGDIVIYYDNNLPIHSGLIVEARNKDINNICFFRVLSKIRKGKEIVHDINKSPYGVDRKFYRIKHEFIIVE